MIINTKSWHYKVWRLAFYNLDLLRFDEPIRTTLCSYVWTIIFFTLMVPVTIPVAIALASIFILATMFVLVFMALWSVGRILFWFFFRAGGIPKWSYFNWKDPETWPCGNHFWDPYTYKDEDGNIVRTSAANSHKPSVLSQWIKAKKQGICPIVIFEEKDENGPFSLR